MYVAGTSALEHMRPSGPLGAMGPSKARLAMPVRSITKRFDGKGEDDAVSSLRARTPILPLLCGARTRWCGRSADSCLPLLNQTQPLYPTIQAGPSVGGEDEAAKIAAMFQAEADQWQQTQETMATCVATISPFPHFVAC